MEIKDTNLYNDPERERIAEQVRKKTKKGKKKKTKIKLSLPAHKESTDSGKTNKRRGGKIALIILILTALVLFFLFAPFFKIKVIKCNGNEKLTESEIIIASHIGMGHNIYRTSLDAAKSGILQLPYVDSAELKRVFPNKIEITVVERNPVAYYVEGNNFVYIDKTGKVLEKKEKSEGVEIAVIENLESEVVKEGEIIKSKKEGKAEFIIEAVGALTKCGLIENVSSIDIAKANNMTFTVNGNLKVTVGAKDKVDYKITFLADKAIKNLGTETKGFLDVSNGKDGVFRETERDVNKIAEESIRKEREEEEAMKKLQEDLEKAQKKLDEKASGTEPEGESENSE